LNHFTFVGKQAGAAFAHSACRLATLIVASDRFFRQGKIYRTQSELIRTAAELKVNIVLPPLLNVALYHKIREKVIALHALGMSLSAIAKSLKINEKTARKAFYYKGDKN